MPPPARRRGGTQWRQGKGRRASRLVATGRAGRSRCVGHTHAPRRPAPGQVGPQPGTRAGAGHRPGCTIMHEGYPPPPITCARENLVNRSVSVWAPQTFSPPLPMHSTACRGQVGRASWRPAHQPAARPVATASRPRPPQHSGPPDRLDAAFAWSASGDRSNSAGTAGTNRENHRNPLSPLKKSVPVDCGDKPETSGDSGDNSFRVRPRAFTPWACLVPGAPDPLLCSAKATPCHRP